MTTNGSHNQYLYVPYNLVSTAMPIATLRYTLPDEQAEYDAARLGSEAMQTLWQIDQRRRTVKRNQTVGRGDSRDDPWRTLGHLTVLQKERDMMNGDTLGLFEEAWAEVKRLRLTDEERAAVEWCIFQQATPQRIAVTLRGLLDRLPEVRS